MEWIFSLDNINNVAKEFWKAMGGKSVVAFYGQMGSGKTTFIHALCDLKGVQDVVGSPTFSIINEYEYDQNVNGIEGTRASLFHIDLYRLRDAEEAMRAGVEDALYSGNICLVEWPEKALTLFPPGSLHARIEFVDDKTRRLQIADI